MNKNYKLIEEIVNKYHPEFKNNTEYQKFALEYHDILNVERLVEYTLAYVGNMEFVDEEGFDFLPCYSDSKTTTVNQNSRKVEIGSVENKIGALRITAYNPIKNAVDFFYVPKDNVPDVIRDCFGKHQFKKRIMFNWNEKDHYNSFEKYRVSTFEELAKATY